MSSLNTLLWYVGMGEITGLPSYGCVSSSGDGGNVNSWNAEGGSTEYSL